MGIATERYAPDAGFSLDAVRLTMPTWTEDDERKLAVIQRDLGYFASPVYTRARDAEFPRRPAQPAKNAPTRAPRRNARCPCGSGRKYRKCHGREE